MNGIVRFRLCDLDDKDLVEAVDVAIDKIYQTGKVPLRNIPARPNEDLDLIIGELLVRFTILSKKTNLKEIITQAYMAGQFEADIDPSYSNAVVYFNGLDLSETT